MRVYLQNPPTIRIGGQVTKSLYQFSMQSPNKPELYDERPQDAKRKSSSSPASSDVTSDLAITSPQVNVDIDRDKAAALQVNANTRRKRVLRRLRPALGLHHLRRHQRIQSSARTEAAISVRPATRSRCCISKAPADQLIPLDTLAHLEARTSARRPSITTASSPRSRFRSISSPATRWARSSTRSRDIAANTLPATISTSFQGAAKAFESSLGNLWVLLIVAILVVYIVLGILYESYIHPHHDSLRPSLGRLRRAGDALPVPHGSQHLRLRRPHHADRHRRRRTPSCRSTSRWTPNATRA